MSVSLLSDPLLYFFSAARIVMYFVFNHPLNSAFTPTSKKSIPDQETAYALFAAATEAPIFFWITAYAVRALEHSFGLNSFFSVPILGRLALYFVVIGVLLAARWAPTWWLTLTTKGLRKKTIMKLIILMSAVLFGLGIGTRVYFFSQPNAAVLHFLFSRPLVTATQMVRQFQAILGIQAGVIVQRTQVMSNIYVNNATLAGAALVFGFIGALFYGVLGTLLLIMGANAAILWGLFNGIIIRNSIVSHNYLGILTTGLASLGVFHGIIEFMGIIVTGVGGAFIAISIVKPKKGSFSTSIIWTLVGIIGFIGFAAFTEVFFDPLVVNFLRQFPIIKPGIVPMNLSTSTIIGITIGLVSSLGLGLIMSWATNQIAIKVEQNV